VPSLTVVEAPSMDGVAKGLFQIQGARPAYTNLKELPLIDKDLKIILSAFRKDLGSDSCFESTAILRCTDESLLI
jgi:hypothetical protein